MLEGAFTILATDCRQPDTWSEPAMIRHWSWALARGENFLGSDVAAFVAYTKRAMEVDQDQAVCVSADKVIVADFNGNVVENPKTYTVDWDASAAEKGGWDSFMDKEIHEDPAAVQRTLLGRFDTNGDITLDEVRIDETRLQVHRQNHRRGLWHRQLRRPGSQIRHRTLGAYPRGNRTRARIPLP